MKNSLTKYLGMAVMLGVLVVILSSFFGVTGVVMAMAGTAIAGSGVTGASAATANASLNMDAVSRLVTEMNPSKNPLDTILRLAVKKHVTVNSWTTRLYETENRPFEDTVSAAYSSGGATGNITVDNISMWTEDDTFRIEGSDNGSGQEVMCYVYAVTRGTNTLSIQPVNKSTIPTIAEDCKIYRLGNAKGDDDAQTDPFAMIPDDSYNYLQAFMAMVKETEYQKTQKKEVDWNIMQYQKQQLYAFRAFLESTYLFGKRGSLTCAGDSDKKYFTGGADYWIDNRITYGPGSGVAEMRWNDLVSIAEQVFASNAGSDIRLMFAGSGFTSAMMNMKTTKEYGETTESLDYILKVMGAKDVDVKIGMRFKEIETQFGTFMFYHHPLLNKQGYTNNAFVIDPANIEKHIWVPTKIEKKDFKTAGISNSDAYVIKETSAPVFRYLETHAILSPKTSA